ncbi:hypothetical protein DL770_007896 [Monosporascus sp. CRB-9-2]|nr:hypothetical protein DL770_007896 [Monosporascus sp. CRB-9-2]
MAREGEIRYSDGWDASPISEAELLVIDGSYTPSADSATFEVVNPMRGERIYGCTSATVGYYSRAIKSHRWRSKPGRAQARSRAASSSSRQPTSSRATCRVTRRPFSPPRRRLPRSWVQVNIAATVGILRESAGLATHIKGEIVPADRPGTTILVERQPVGVVFAISPWKTPVSS